MLKKNITVAISLFLAISIGVFHYIFNIKNSQKFINASINESAQVISQQIVSVDEKPKTVYKMYDSGKLVGIIKDKDFIYNKLNEVYKIKYKEKFPNSRLDIGQDLYIVEEMSYYTFENIDNKIFDYLLEKNLFTLSSTAIEFSNSDGVYSIIYVSDISIFDDALNRFLKLFVDEESLNLLQNSQKTGAISGYGSRVVSVDVVEEISNKPAYTSEDKIMTSSDEVLEYLKYGENTERVYYTVKQYDTIEGVGSKNFGLSAEQVMNLNSDIIKSTQQILEPGTILNVTYFTSPLEVVVNKESVRNEDVYPETPIYVEDPNLREGYSEVVQNEVPGKRNVLYNEKWINGVLVNGTEVSSVTTVQPIQEIIKVGTLVIPGEGTGIFRWPVDNPVITCAWGCYLSHRAIDIKNQYDRYGNIYASDRGVVKESSYTGINGNYVVIDHNNGFETYYGHMNVPSPLKVGDVVDKGDYIGQIGMTGYAKGPHVHFFIIENGERRDPCKGFLPC